MPRSPGTRVRAARKPRPGASRAAPAGPDLVVAGPPGGLRDRVRVALAGRVARVGVADRAGDALDAAAAAVAVLSGAADPIRDLCETVARGAAARRSVIVLRPGASEVERAALRQHGALVVRSVEDLVESAALLAAIGLPRGRRLVAAAGEAAALLGDAAADAGLTLAVEPAPQAAGSLRRRQADVLLDATWDAGAELRRAAADAGALAVPVSPEGAGRTLRALRALVDHADALRRAGEPPRALWPDGAAAAAREILDGCEATLTEAEAKALLAAYGVAVTRDRVAMSASAAAAAARELGFPVALKVISPDLRRRTEAGAVALGVDSAAEARAAYHRVLVGARRASASARLEGVLVSEMVPRGIEICCRVEPHPDLGPVVRAGLAGPAGEAADPGTGPHACRVCPLTGAEAEAMLRELPGARILRGAGRRPPADTGALCDLLVRIAAIGSDLRDAIETLDVDLVVRPAGKGAPAVSARATRPAGRV